MAQAGTPQFHGRLKALYLGAKPFTRRDLHPLLMRHFPLCAPSEFPARPTHHELATAFQSTLPKFCIVEIEKWPDAGTELIPELLRLDPRIGILAVLPQKLSDMVLPCLRLGATDFLIPPFTEEHVASAAQKLIKLLPRTESTAAGKVFCVMPAKGACGATTVACNLAFGLKRETSQRVLLADLDPLTGTIGFLLKLKSQFSFVDVAARSSDMDADLWKAMVVNTQGVDVLLAPETLVGGASEFMDASPILDYARYKYDIVVADAGAGIGLWSLSQAQSSDEVVLIATNDLLSVHAAQRALRYLESNGVGRWKIKVVLNRNDLRMGLRRDVIATALDTDIYHTLPSNQSAVHTSLLNGKPIVQSCNLGKSLSALAERLAGTDEVSKKGSFSSLLRYAARFE